MKISKEYILIYFIAFIMAICIGYLVFEELEKISSLSKNKEHTNAIIVDFSIGVKLRRYIDYKFIINGKSYYGSGRHYPKNDIYSIGDSIIVIYDKTDPDNNKIWRDYKRMKANSPYIIPFFICLGIFLWWAYKDK